MNKLAKLFMALGLSTCMTVGGASLAACTAQAGKSAYEIAVEHGFEGTEEEWLESLKGNDAKAPDIKIGENGNWYINGIDTGIKATGADGAKGDKGDKGAQGEQGEKGESGNTWLVGEGDPIKEDGKAGDLYLDTESGNIWHKGEEGWEFKLCIKGEAEPEETEVQLGTHELTANIGKEVEINVKPGNYQLTVTLESETTPVKEGLMAKVGDSTISYDLYEATNNEYTGVLIVKDGDGKITFTAKEGMTVELSLTPYETPVLKLNEEYIVPSITATDSRYLPISIDPSLCNGTYKVSVYNETNSMMYLYSSDNTTSLGILMKGNKSYLSANIKFDEVPQICFRSPYTLKDKNIRVKIEAI